MTWIHGYFCTSVNQTCKVYKDSKDNKFARCQEFNPTVCIGKKIPLNYCIDTEEYSDDNNLPKNNLLWIDAKNICEEHGKRLCSETEWTFACEGEESLPYPTGLIRPSNICNIDIEQNVVCNNNLCDYRKSIYDNPLCVSPFGIHDMVGNVDEMIMVSPYHHSKYPDLILRSSFKGGHWLPVRNRCRPRTDDHGEIEYSAISAGFRCCSEIKNDD